MHVTAHGDLSHTRGLGKAPSTPTKQARPAGPFPEPHTCPSLPGPGSSERLRDWLSICSAAAPPTPKPQPWAYRGVRPVGVVEAEAFGCLLGLFGVNDGCREGQARQLTLLGERRSARPPDSARGREVGCSDASGPRQASPPVRWDQGSNSRQTSHVCPFPLSAGPWCPQMLLRAPRVVPSCRCWVTGRPRCPPPPLGPALLPTPPLRVFTHLLCMHAS